MKSLQKTIMLIPPTELPIPAVGGGAIETLITHLLNVNEEKQLAEFVVISKYDESAEGIKYKHSKIFYFKDSYYVGSGHRVFRLLWRMYCVWYKLFQNHIVVKVLKKEYCHMGFLQFQCYQIAKKEHISGLVYEGLWNETLWGSLQNLVGSDHVYTHIHCERKENIRVRKQVHNSISISDFVRKQWAETDGLQGKDVVLYNCIDTYRFQHKFSLEQKKMLKERLGIEQDRFLVIFCGRLIKEKGIQELLDCFDKLKDYPITLMLIGSVGFSANTTTDFSESMLKHASEMKNVAVLGYIPNEKMPEYYSIADLQVIPSIWQEGAGLVAIEGMASGLPIVATKSGGMQEYLSDDAAIQLPIDDCLAQNMATAILELYQNLDKRIEMGNAGIKRAGEFSKEVYYDEYVKLFD